jgi:hypothetical protein
MAKRKRKPALAVGISDYVLLGGTRASYPEHWYYGQVLWIGDGDVLVQRSNAHGDRWREVISSSQIRAVGTREKLSDLKRRASEGVRDLQRRIDEVTSALGDARDALFKHLDALAEKGLDIVPPDFVAIDAEIAERRAIQERTDAEGDAP